MSKRAFGWSFSALFAALTVSVAGRAQTPPTSASSEVTLPKAPPVDDPLLAPPPAAPKTIHSWSEALDEIRRQSPEYRATAQDITRAEAQSRIALAGILPQVAAQGAFTHQLITQQLSLGGPPITVPSQNVWSAGATLVWPILSPRAYHQWKTAEQAVGVSKLDFNEKRREIAVSAVNAMLATLAAERVAELNRVGLRGALERLALAKTKVQFGQGTPLDVDRADQDAEAARAQVISGDESLRQAREALGLALGSSTATAAPGDLDLDGFEKTVIGSCRVESDIDDRADVVAARARVDLAERAVTDAKLLLSPSVSVQSAIAYNSQVTFGPLTTWQVQGVLTVPIYDGGARYGSIDDAKAAVEQSKAALTSARLNAMIDLTQSTRAVEVLGASRDVAQRQRDLAERIDHRTREGFVRGLGTSLDLVTSAQALRQAEINVVLLQFQAAEARVKAVLAKADCAY